MAGSLHGGRDKKSGTGSQGEGILSKYENQGTGKREPMDMKSENQEAGIKRTLRNSGTKGQKIREPKDKRSGTKG